MGGVRCSFGKPNNRARANTLVTPQEYGRPGTTGIAGSPGVLFTRLFTTRPHDHRAGRAKSSLGRCAEVSAILQNIGASTITEPLSQAPATTAPTPGSPYGSTSTADAPETTVTVLLSRIRQVDQGRRSRWEQSRPRRFHRAAWSKTRRRFVHAAVATEGFRGRRWQVLRVVPRQLVEQHIGSKPFKQPQHARGRASDEPAAAWLAGNRTGAAPQASPQATPLNRKSRSRICLLYAKPAMV